MPPLVLTPSPKQRVVRKRTRRDPKPHFKPNQRGQMDAVTGCPELQVSRRHLARRVLKEIERIDLSQLEAKYSSLGRHGYSPRDVLAVLVYASLVGLHQSTELARALQTDAALRFLSGGHAISHQTLRRFRTQNASFIETALQQTVSLAHEDGLLDPGSLATDSVRLRANASTRAVRTVVRSKKRLAELAQVDLGALSPEAREEHDAKLRKHREGLARCEAAGRTNVVLTNESAGLLKFPDGASAPGHRATVTACGVRERFVVSVLIDAAPNDYGKLPAALEQTRRALFEAGVPEGTMLQVAADAGYFSRSDLEFARDNREWVDVLIAGESATTKTRDGLFGHEAFPLQPDGSRLCPAGKPMLGPYTNKNDPGVEAWHGSACGDCSLRAQCTTARRRNITVRPDMDRARAAMSERMGQPGAQDRYNQRIATIEPVFSNLESTMKFRRVNSRRPESTRAEILLKLLAHNISRLAAARQLRCVLVCLTEF